MSQLVGILVTFLLLAANGFFVAVEFALVAADRSKLELLADEGKWSAKAATSARARLSFHLSGAQLGITVTSLILGFLVDSLIGPLVNPILEPFPFLAGPTISVIVALAVASSFQMVIGELFPKALAISSPERLAMTLAPIALVIHGALGPIIRLLNGAANRTVMRLGIEPQEELAELRSLKELDYLIRASGESGTLAPGAREILTRTIRFGDKTAAEALRPRVQVEAVPVDCSVAGALAMARDSNYSKFPVYIGDIDHIVGTVAIASMFDVEPAARSTTSVGDIMREPLVVPETKDLIDILDDFRDLDPDAPMAVVVDEHGGTAGILTLEDVLEEIVGEVDDEYDESIPLTAGVAPGIYLLAGTLHADEVEESCEFAMPDGDYETIAGFVLDQLGRIPATGDSFHYDGWSIQVAEMDQLRIASLRLVAPHTAITEHQGVGP
jgi:CBS domain containing-hemolysin-like protein